MWLLLDSLPYFMDGKPELFGLCYPFSTVRLSFSKTWLYPYLSSRGHVCSPWIPIPHGDGPLNWLLVRTHGSEGHIFDLLELRTLLWVLYECVGLKCNKFNIKVRKSLNTNAVHLPDSLDFLWDIESLKKNAFAWLVAFYFFDSCELFCPSTLSLQ